MKLRFFVLAFFVIVLAGVGSFIGCRSSKPADSYAGLSLPALYQLMDATGLIYEKTPESIVAATQAGWLRKGERWETPDLFEDKKEQFKPYFEALNLIETWLPAHKKFNGIMIAGATIMSLQGKTRFVQELLNQGIQFDCVVVLTGNRPLIEKERDILQALGADLNNVTTEYEMSCFFFGDSDGKAIVDGKPLAIVNAPEVTLPNGTKRRPTRAETIEQWIKEGAKPGSYLLISQQPHCNFEKVVLQTSIPKEFTLEVAGRGDLYQTRVAVYLDALARTLYQQFHADQSTAKR